MRRWDHGRTVGGRGGRIALWPRPGLGSPARGDAVAGGRYSRRPRIFSSPALAQFSSRSPPGAPAAPIAPIIWSLILITTPPPN